MSEGRADKNVGSTPVASVAASITLGVSSAGADIEMPATTARARPMAVKSPSTMAAGGLRAPTASASGGALGAGGAPGAAGTALEAAPAPPELAGGDAAAGPSLARCSSFASSGASVRARDAVGAPLRAPDAAMGSSPALLVAALGPPGEANGLTTLMAPTCAARASPSSVAVDIGCGPDWGSVGGDASIAGCSCAALGGVVSALARSASAATSCAARSRAVSRSCRM